MQQGIPEGELAPVTPPPRTEITTEDMPRIAGERFIKDLIIPDGERLFPTGYKPDVRAAVVRETKRGYSGCPTARLHWDDEKKTYQQWINHDPPRPAEWLVGTPDNRPAYFADHPKINTPEIVELRARARAGEDVEWDEPEEDGSFPAGKFGDDVVVDSRGWPVNPFAEIMLENDAITGRGPNRKLSKRRSGDKAIFRINEEGQLCVAVLERIDGNGIALPGGGFEPEKGDTNLSDAGTRETSEELGILRDVIEAMQNLGIAFEEDYVADPRNTINMAGRSSELTVLVPTDEQVEIESVRKLNNFDPNEVKSAFWMIINEKNLSLDTERVPPVFAMHRELIMAGARLLEEKTGWVVGKDGRVGKKLRQQH